MSEDQELGEAIDVTPTLDEMAQLGEAVAAYRLELLAIRRLLERRKALTEQLADVERELSEQRQRHADPTVFQLLRGAIPFPHDLWHY